MKLGIIDEPLVLLYNSIAVVISLTHILLPQMFLSMQSVMAEIDGNLTLAAEGISEPYFFRCPYRGLYQDA